MEVGAIPPTPPTMKDRTWQILVSGGAAGLVVLIAGGSLLASGAMAILSAMASQVLPYLGT